MTGLSVVSFDGREDKGARFGIEKKHTGKGFPNIGFATDTIPNGDRCRSHLDGNNKNNEHARIGVCYKYMSYHPI